jgi:hypothetical protein
MKSTSRFPASIPVFLVAILLGAGTILADWQEGDSHKMHYPQLPDLSPMGMDVCAMIPRVVADDFMCMEDGPITAIHIWGSWMGDIEDPEPSFILSIHVDIPAGESPTGYSMPGDTVWLKYCSPTQYTSRIQQPGLMEGWYDPFTGEFNPMGDTICFQYNFPIDVQDAFVQSSGTIYWLDVQYLPSTNEPPAMFGWKTAIPDFHWNDDAAWTMGEEPLPPGQTWTDLRYPPIHPMADISIDLAFVIDGGYTDDFGDAPDPMYPTLLANNGASHVIVPGYCMGTAIDAEPDGQPNATATGDDSNGAPDDEDGVVFTTPIIQGASAGITVTVTGTGQINAWIDFNADGDWADAGEQIFTNQAAVPGANQLNFTVPLSASLGSTFLRVRFSTLPGLSYNGPAPDGEVEDYQVMILEGEVPQEVDFGDADDSPYPTLLANDGARHVIVSNICLGTAVDADPDGQPDGTATGDDNSGVPDDEDGVILPPYLLQGQTGTVQVIASVPGYLWAWIDFAGNGDWNDAGEQIFNGQALAQGTNALQFPVPAHGAAAPQGRFRFTTNQIPQTFTGQADNGEVEDYEVNIVDSDYGDAPAPYPTLHTNNGAVHIISGGLYLGNVGPDNETDGQPNATATGDDIAGTPDDGDGVVPQSLFAPGNTAFADVIASGSGLLSIWIDYNADGDWADTNELVAADVPLTAGTNSLSFKVPREVVSTNTFVRARFSSAGGLSYTGIAADGEVEDYMITIEPPIEITVVDQNSPSNIVIQSMGYYGSGTIQVLQASTNLLGTNWTDRATNASPVTPPQTNVWVVAPQNGNDEFYRIRQR